MNAAFYTVNDRKKRKQHSHLKINAQKKNKQSDKMSKQMVYAYQITSNT